jgi:8-hydroxy-5-deazaflavin:NADPH oxidoreductase
MTETRRIGIVGAGRIGQALAVRLVTVGREVMLSNSRGPDSLAVVVGSLGAGARAGTVEEAARFGDVVAVAIPPSAIYDLPPEPFAGKLVVDANNYFPGADAGLQELDADGTTSSELLASLLPGARVVKAFNAIQFQRLLDHSRPELPPEERLAIPVAGDDPEAKRIVLDLIDEIGFTGVDTGTLAESRRQQPGSPLLRVYADARRNQTWVTAAQVRDVLADEFAARPGS